MADAPQAAALLRSRTARERLDGIRRVEDAGGPAQLILPLLDDDAPYVFAHGGNSWVAEVRADALVAVQNLYRLGRKEPDFGPVKVRKAMRADDAQAQARSQLSAMPPALRDRVLATADLHLDERVRPAAFELRPCRSYQVLLELGRIPYELQEVDPETLLTPLQAAVSRSQMVSERPRPHLRFDVDGQPVGYMYRDGSRWVQDFAEAPESGRIRRMLGSFMRAEGGQLPRVVGAVEGTPRSNPDGSLVLDGVVPRDVQDPAVYLASLAAFCQGLFTCELVR